jgi:hypothetical protein
MNATRPVARVKTIPAILQALIRVVLETLSLHTTSIEVFEELRKVVSPEAGDLQDCKRASSHSSNMDLRPHPWSKPPPHVHGGD